MEDLLTPRQRELRGRTEEIVQATVAPRADEVDREAMWPAHSLAALAQAGLMGLVVPTATGGEGQGLTALTLVTETLARGCSSSALCYGMHCVGTAVIAAKATRWQTENFLAPIAQGRHITTLSLSESGTGSNFYIAETRLTRENNDGFLLDGTKQFVTNGGHADSYVVSTQASADSSAGEFNCMLVRTDTPGMRWLDPWRGLGMRGNSSRGLRLTGARVPREHLLGEEGDQIWYVFEVIAPYFLMAMSATYLGIAQAALDIALAHVRARRFTYLDQRLAEVNAVQHKVAELWTLVEKTRGLIYQAARLGDIGDPRALTSILACKADVAATAVTVTNEAMTLAGGSAYRENSQLARLLRDARAAHVMAPTSDMLREWLGRALLDVPLL